jgi:hypothetical protein
MAIKFTNIFHWKRAQIILNWDFWFENIWQLSGNPAAETLSILVQEQGDQIVLNFDYWVAVYFGKFL